MAAPAIYPSPAEQMRLLLAEARRRHEPFAEAWSRAMGEDLGHQVTWRDPDPPPGRVVWPRDTFDRRAWIVAMRSPAVRKGFEGAYYLDPPPRAVMALSGLGPVLATLSRAEAPERLRVGYPQRPVDAPEPIQRRTPWTALVHGALAEGPATAAELCERLGCDRRTVRRALYGLTDSGKVSRDGDTYTLTLTQARAPVAA
jgi:hypothetical protein